MKEILKRQVQSVARQATAVLVRSVTRTLYDRAHEAVVLRLEDRGPNWVTVQTKSAYVMNACSVLLSELGAFKGAKHLICRYVYYDGQNHVTTVPGQGTYQTMWKGKPLFAEIIREESKDKTDYTLKIRGEGRELVESFLEEARSRVEDEQDEEGRVGIRRWKSKEWSEASQVEGRALESVVLREGQKEGITSHLDRFFAGEGRYKELGVPYRTGILLEGPPGTGKTSLCRALASRYDRDIFIADPADMSDAGFIHAMREIPSGQIVLFEDIDSASASVDRETQDQKDDSLASLRGLTLKGLLNGIDGVESPEDTVFIMTTNRPQVLDEALTRPGRIDLKVHLGNATAGQCKRLHRRFFPDAPEEEATAYAEESEGKSPAKVQAELLSRKGSLLD